MRHRAAPPTTERKVLGQVLVCVGCCCGRPDKGKPPVPAERLKTEWKRRRLLRRVHLTISGCLGPCDLVNVVCLAAPGGLRWLGGLTQDGEYEALLEWATRSAEAGRMLPLPSALEARAFEGPFPQAAHGPGSASGAGNGGPQDGPWPERSPCRGAS